MTTECKNICSSNIRILYSVYADEQQFIDNYDICTPCTFHQKQRIPKWSDRERIRINLIEDNDEYDIGGYENVVAPSSSWD